MKPAPNTSTNAPRLDDCGDRPAVAMDSMTPSKLQDIIKDPDLMPFMVALATSSAFFTAPDDPTIRLVSSGRSLFSSTRPGVSVSGGNIRLMRILSETTSCCKASPRPRSANLLAE